MGTMETTERIAGQRSGIVCRAAEMPPEIMQCMKFIAK